MGMQSFNAMKVKSNFENIQGLVYSEMLLNMNSVDLSNRQQVPTINNFCISIAEVGSTRHSIGTLSRVFASFRGLSVRPNCIHEQALECSI